MPINKRHNLLFVHIPKTAGGSIEKALDMYGSKNEGYNFINQSILYGYRQVMPNNWREYQATASTRNRQLVKITAKINGWKQMKDLTIPLHHLTFEELKNHIRPTDYFSFSFVRNPFERTVSEYLWKAKTGSVEHDTFEEYVEHYVQYKHHKDRHLLPQYFFITDNNERLLVNFLGKFESLKSDFERLIKQLGISAELPELHSTQKYDYRDYYSSISRDIISKLYAKDLKIFDFSF